MKVNFGTTAYESSAALCSPGSHSCRQFLSRSNRQFYVYKNIPEFVHVTADDVSSVPVAFCGAAYNSLQACSTDLQLAKNFSPQGLLQASVAVHAALLRLRAAAAAAAAASWVICKGCSLLQSKP